VTRIYPTRKSALETGIFYLGRSKDMKVEDLCRVQGDVSQINGNPLGAQIYELTNSNGIKCKIATAPCRDGFDLWLIKPNGLAVRA